MYSADVGLEPTMVVQPRGCAAPTFTNFANLLCTSWAWWDLNPQCIKVLVSKTSASRHSATHPKRRFRRCNTSIPHILWLSSSVD